MIRRDAGPTVVVGGGIIGLSIAYELVRRGRTPVVLDATPRGETGETATRVAAGMLAPASEADDEPAAVVALGRDSLARYPAFVGAVERDSERSCGYRDDGTLWIAVNRDEDAELERLMRAQARHGLDVRKLDAAAVRDLEPHVTPRAVGGMLAPGDHSVDPRRLAEALALAVRRGGGTIHAGWCVDRIEPSPVDDAGWRVGGTEGGWRNSVDAAEVVVAAGARVTAAIEWIGASPGCEVRPVRGEVVRLRGAPLVERSIRTPRIYLVPRTDGELVIGATTEERGFDADPTAGGTMDLLRHAFVAVPGVYDLVFAEVSAGWRPATVDHIPVIDRLAPGLFAAIGHYRNGILLAPATAQLLAEFVVGGERPPALERFAVDRFRSEGGNP